ncbi:cytochrome P450 [Obba rivulosa]|uniref:Cytochrome P450 n=1 Tax=Obba rivulosa TaxID=1052685 RepID=A0A8E2AH60_9APHY|nr:cytochrome P450 [Obba rivulosa]
MAFLLLDIVAAACALVLLVRLYQRERSPKLLLPPGPPRLPLLGNLFDVPNDGASKIYLQMGQKLGSDVVCLNAVGTYIVVLNSPSAVADLLEKRSTIYSDRPWMIMLCELIGLGWSMPLMPYGETWKLSRKMFHQEFSLGAVERYRQVELQGARNLLSRLLHQPEGFLEHIRHMAGAVIIRIAYGIEVQAHDDPYIRIAEEAIQAASAASTPGAYLVDALPILKHVPSWLPGTKFKQEAAEFRKWVDATLNSSYAVVQKQIASGDAPDCAATSLLETFGKNASGDLDTEHVIKSTLATIYLAGADTTVSTLATFFLAMALYPDVQVKAREELDAVLGGRRLPELSDQESMPYITSIMKESLRWKPVVPLNFPHRLTEDDVYRGYHLPKGSLVLANNWAILHDEDMYPDPSAFKPDRFMKDGKLDSEIRDPATAAFGFGRRICPGRYMAQDQLWIVIASVLATFEIGKEVDGNGQEIMPETDSLPGFLSHPRPFKCTIKPRSRAHAALVEAAT